MVAAITIMGRATVLNKAAPWKCVPDTFGTEAPIVPWALDPDHAALVLTQTVVDATILDTWGKTLTQKNVIVVGEGASSDPLYRTVLVSDVRWALRFLSIVRSYNVRATTGDPRLIAGPNPNVPQVVDTFAFRLYSIMNQGGAGGDRPWQPVEMLTKDLLPRLKKALQAMLGANRQLDILTNISPRAPYYPEVLLRGHADAELARVFSRIGAIDMRVDPATGSIVIADRKLGDEIPFVQTKVPYVARNWGQLRLASYAGRRSPSWTFGIPVETEVRADLIELPNAGVALTTTQPSGPAANNPFLLNMIEVTDLSFKLANGGTACMGQLVEVGLYMASLALNPPLPRAAAAMTFAFLQQWFNGPNLRELYAGGYGGNAPSGILGRRVSALLANYRSIRGGEGSLGLNPRCVGMTVPGSIVPYRAALVDLDTRQRASAFVAVDYVEIPTMRSLVSSDAFHGFQNDAFPWAAGVPASQQGEKTYAPDPQPIANLKASPAILVVDDSEAGRLHIEMQLDQVDHAQQLLASRLLNLPCVDMRMVATKQLPPVLAKCPLSAGHRITVIFSCQPGGPNDERQFYNVTVMAAQAFARLGIPPQSCTAPARFEAIPSQLDTARIAWDDNLRNQILALFEAGTNGPSSDLIPINLQDLEDLCLNLASSYMATVLDHFVGTQEILFDPSWTPVGSIHKVVHGLDALGGLRTTLVAEDHAPAPNLEGSLKDSTRAAIWGARQ